jgi:hypothetical protein
MPGVICMRGVTSLLFVSRVLHMLGLLAVRHVLTVHLVVIWHGGLVHVVRRMLITLSVGRWLLCLGRGRVVVMVFVFAHG